VQALAAPGQPDTLFLLFQIGDEGYALAVDQIVEILPLVGLQSVRHAPPGIAGLFNYRGQFVPVIDLSEIELGRSAHSRLSTRIVMMRYAQDGDAPQLLGLIAEKATETLRCDLADFAPFAASQRGLVQRIELDALLPVPLRNFLSAKMAECR
jgi:chemotaxis-related protein WspB